MRHVHTLRFQELVTAVGVTITAAMLAGCGGFTTPSTASSSATNTVASKITSNALTFKFKTIDNNTDPTFNQLLGINDSRIISGYYGSGTPPSSHPNKGYTVSPPYKQANFASENYPGSMQTQVTCIDNLGNTGGFWVDSTGVTRGFIEWNGVFTSYAAPKAVMTQILGLNDSGTAVGFYTNKKNVAFGFSLGQASGTFSPVTPPGATNVTAAGINNNGDIVGFYVASSQMIGFLEKKGKFSTFSYPGSTMTMATGVNIKDDIVGVYALSGAMHGYLLQNPLTKATFTSIDDPNGLGTTTINGINDRLNMVGFYVDSNGNTNGMLVEKKK